MLYDGIRVWRLDLVGPSNTASQVPLLPVALPDRAEVGQDAVPIVEVEGQHEDGEEGHSEAEAGARGHGAEDGVTHGADSVDHEIDQDYDEPGEHQEVLVVEGAEKEETANVD